MAAASMAELQSSFVGKRIRGASSGGPSSPAGGQSGVGKRPPRPKTTLGRRGLLGRLNERPPHKINIAARRDIQLRGRFGLYHLARGRDALVAVAL
jgi:hypothetical protein